MSALVTHGRYELIEMDATSIIRRQDSDRKRTVAFVRSAAEWDRFTQALDRGLDEVAAVHAIDDGDS